MSDPFFLEAATEEDLASLLALEREGYTHPWTPKHFRDALAAAGALCVVLRTRPSADHEDASIVAYCVAQIVVDELHVHNLLVRPGERSRGVGRRLLRILLGVAARRGARVALLEVRQSNWPALQLYRSLGFEAVALRRDYYERPREDAVLLRKGDLVGVS
jgi:[ribosomal protein S18]-alanine N-acetyltransferase